MRDPRTAGEWGLGDARDGRLSGLAHS
jgi:hypothetical protein